MEEKFMTATYAEQCTTISINILGYLDLASADP